MKIFSATNETAWSVTISWFGGEIWATIYIGLFIGDFATTNRKIGKRPTLIFPIFLLVVAKSPINKPI